jgi:hypothetical protein
MGWYKCNVDARFHNDLNKTSVGWCLKDHLGSFIKARTFWMEGKYSIVERESLTLLKAMTYMEHQGVTHVIF